MASTVRRAGIDVPSPPLIEDFLEEHEVAAFVYHRVRNTIFDTIFGGLAPGDDQIRRSSPSPSPTWPIRSRPRRRRDPTDVGAFGGDLRRRTRHAERSG